MGKLGDVYAALLCCTIDSLELSPCHTFESYISDACDPLPLPSLGTKVAYGEEAFRWMTPLTFALPEELPEWRQWLRDHPSPEETHEKRTRWGWGRQKTGRAPLQGGGDKELWILKTGQDAGE